MVAVTFTCYTVTCVSKNYMFLCSQMNVTVLKPQISCDFVFRKTFHRNVKWSTQNSIRNIRHNPLTMVGSSNCN